MEKLVIIGGGIAGLSCLNALLDNQVSPLLIEGGNIGSKKMCGEFIAPSALALLKQWDIGPIEYIHQVCFQSTFSQFSLAFKQPAGAMMRSEAECQLSLRANKLGGRIRENTRLSHIIPATKNSPYILHLESGEIIEAETAIFATGKWAQNTKQKIQLPYYGIKLHMEGIIEPNILQMYSAPGAYFGLVPVSHNISNLTCLIKNSNITNQNSKQVLTQLIKIFPSLDVFFREKNLDQFDWLTAQAPDFLLKKLPNWTNTYWIGDALGSIPPAIGLGFAHSINSGMLSADYYLKNKANQFLSSSITLLNKKMLLGKCMHYIMMHPFLTSLVFPLLEFSPWFLNRCLKRLGYLGTL